MKVSVPPSKSISNRALVLGLLNPGEKIIKNVLRCDDTIVMLQSLYNLGVEFEILREDERSFDIRIKGGEVDAQVEVGLYLGNAGTAVRFLTPALCNFSGSFVLEGSERMHQRPIGDLVNALRELGASIEYLDLDGFLPIRIIGSSSGLSGSCIVKGDISSQYYSGLLIAQAFNDFEVKVDGELVSAPYVELTRGVISDFMSSSEYEVEGDASSASYFWALGAISDLDIEVTNVPSTTLQADIKFLDALKELGDFKRGARPMGRDFNCVEYPDSAMTLAMLCGIAEGESVLSGLSNLKFKECDRLKALETEMNKVGCKVEAFDDGLKIVGVSPEDLKAAQIETYDDHRVAMCFALYKYLNPEIEILNPECVSKTYPTFWEEFLV